MVVSRHAKYKLTQDPMNGVLFKRLGEILDGKQSGKLRLYFIIDEFQMLAGDQPCPGIIEAFLLLRSRGVTFLLTYQALTTLKRIYGEHVSELIGQCTNVIYLRQPDLARPPTPPMI
ncbi:MAG: TraM recognition domain-containing protein [Singulisphaera sp.]